MAITVDRKKIIITIIITVLFVTAAGVYAFSTGIFTPSSSEENEQVGEKPDVSTGTAYKEVLKEKQDEVNVLVAAGGEKSVQQAEEIIEQEVQAATESGNVAYLVDAQLAKAGLLIQTGRAQEALDTILLTLESDYQGDEAYIYLIYAQISWAYKELDNLAKSEEYLDKIPGGGWD